MSTQQQSRFAGSIVRSRFIAVSIALAFGFTGVVVLHFRVNRSKKPRADAEQIALAHAHDGTTFAEYAGSATCADCHADAFDQWRHSHHALAERPVAGAIPATSALGLAMTLTNGLPGIASTSSVARVIGEGPLQQFLVPLPGGRFQAFDVAFDPRSNDWFDIFGNDTRTPGDWGHWTGRGMNWNSMCASCHNTRLQKNYDAVRDTYATTMAEMSVGCEACHGPLKAHNDWQQRFGKFGRVDPTVKKLSREQTMENCAFCHSRRSELTEDFKPGDRFSDHMRLMIVDRSGAFYADGQVREEDYEYAAFLGSRMHAAGIGCTDCHNPHTAKTILPGNWLCMRCHDGSRTNAPVINPVEHSHHRVFGYDQLGNVTNLDLTAYNSARVKETGGECVNCHMPATTFMQRHARHDHGFTIPDPLLTKQSGIPNACNRCHQDKDADWALKSCDEWFGEKMQRRTRQRTQAIADAGLGKLSAREALQSLAATEPIPYWRAVMIGFMGNWANETSVRDLLLRSLSDTNDLVRTESIRALEPSVASGDDEAAVAVQKCWNDPIRSVRLAAAWTLRDQIDPQSTIGKELLTSLRVHADQPLGRVQLGAFHLAQGNLALAREHYRKAAEWDSRSTAIRRDYAVILSKLKDDTGAIEQLQAASLLEPRDADIQFELALAYSAVGDLGKAIAALRKAVELNPKHSRAWYNLGLALHQVGRNDEALHALGQSETFSPTDPRPAYARATILAQLKRPDEARNAAEQSLKAQPDYVPALELLKLLSDH